MQSISQLLRTCSVAMAACASDLDSDQFGGTVKVPASLPNVVSQDTDDVVMDDDGEATVAFSSSDAPPHCLDRDRLCTTRRLESELPVAERPPLTVYDMFTSANGRAHLLLHVSHGHVDEVRVIKPKKESDKKEDRHYTKYVPLTLRPIDADGKVLVAEYPPGVQLEYLSNSYPLDFKWAATEDAASAWKTCREYARLPKISGFVASGDALNLPSECEWGERLEKSTFTLMLEGRDHAAIHASQLSLVPVPCAADPPSVAAIAEEFAVLSIEKASVCPLMLINRSAFTVTCLRGVRRVSCTFYVCINGAAIGRVGSFNQTSELSVNQEPPARVYADHCMTADTYFVRLSGETAEGKGHHHPAMHQWTHLIQTLIPYTKLGIMEHGRFVLVSFPRADVERVLQKAGSSRVLFMCGSTCIWTLEPEWVQRAHIITEPYELAPVMLYAPAEWVVTHLESATAINGSKLGVASVEVFGPDGARIMPACCMFTGLIQGDLRQGDLRQTGSIEILETELYITSAHPGPPGHYSVQCGPRFFLMDTCNKLLKTLEHNGASLVQRESAEIAALTWMREAMFITSIQPTFMCITIRGTVEQQALLADMVFDHVEKVADNTYVMPKQQALKGGMVMYALALCARGVQIDKLLVLEKEAAPEMHAVIIYGADSDCGWIWLVLLAKGGLGGSACYDALEPAHFVITKPKVELYREVEADGRDCGEYITLDVTQVGKMPHRMVCAQYLSSCDHISELNGLSSQPRIIFNDKPIPTVTWRTGDGEISAAIGVADLERISCGELKTILVDKLNALDAGLKSDSTCFWTLSGAA